MSARLFQASTECVRVEKGRYNAFVQGTCVGVIVRISEKDSRWAFTPIDTDLYETLTTDDMEFEAGDSRVEMLFERVIDMVAGTKKPEQLSMLGEGS